MHLINAQTLKSWLHDGAEIALLDVREHGQYGESHLFYGTTLPYSRLELDVQRLVPRQNVRLVIYDDGQGIAAQAAERLAALEYSNVHVLDGGTPMWAAAGFTLFAGVNVPSKTFGELVEHLYETPHVTATELAHMLHAGEDVVVLDGRPFTEYRKMAIPTATNCPNGELAYRIGRLVPSDKTRIVINCAGRTRSIIGAQTLINLGLPNPVAALQSGTQGWVLADLMLEHGAARRYDEPGNTESMRRSAEALAERYDVPVVDAATVQAWAGDTQRTLFLCDVRTPEEFAAGSLIGAQHTSGGQLVQATDQYIGVRHARLVLFDSDGIRARVTASWLRQMGHDAYVLAQGIHSGLTLTHPAPVQLPAPTEIEVTTLNAWLREGKPVLVIDLRASMRFRESHIPDARWSIRPHLEAMLAGETRSVILIADEPGIAACAAQQLADTELKIYTLAGGFPAWIEAGLPLQSSPDSPPDNECIDYLFFVHDRHDGNKAAARQYLEWEINLISQLDEHELGEFRLPTEKTARH